MQVTCLALITSKTSANKEPKPNKAEQNTKSKPDKAEPNYCVSHLTKNANIQNQKK